MRTSISRIQIGLLSLIVCAWAAGPALLRAAPPQAFSVIHSFAGSPTDGSMPTWDASLAASGSTLYGITQMGGSSSNGVLFKINSNGSGYQILHAFNGYILFLNPSGSKNDGALPTGTPVVSGSTIYGLTTLGGSNGLGTIYRINTEGSGFEILHHFVSNNRDGYQPDGTSLTLSGSTLYGMASGGSNSSVGVVFKIETNGSNYEILRQFTALPNALVHPSGRVIVSGSTLYGMTRMGATTGHGGLFKMNTDGSGYQVLHMLIGTTTDGGSPFGSPLLDNGTLYGMTSIGGANGVGTVFKISTNGSGFQIIHSFALNEGWSPSGDVILVGSKLYGMTKSGGAGGLGSGVLFEVGTDGSGYQVLHTFTFAINGNNGVFPFGSPLLVGSALYGLASLGGTHNQGCIFSYRIDGGGTGTAELTGSFSKLKEVCKTKRGVLGCTLTTLLTMQNIGTAPSVPTHLRYFLSSDNVLDVGDTQFGEKRLPKVKPAKVKKLRVKTKTTSSTVGMYLLAANDAGEVLAAAAIVPE